MGSILNCTPLQSPALHPAGAQQRSVVYFHRQPLFQTSGIQPLIHTGVSHPLGVMDTYFSLPTCLAFPAEHCVKWLFSSSSAQIFLSKLLPSLFVGKTCHMKHPNLLLSVAVCFLLPPQWQFLRPKGLVRVSSTCFAKYYLDSRGQWELTGQLG